eukprot:EG_transcript_16666
MSRQRRSDSPVRHERRDEIPPIRGRSPEYPEEDPDARRKKPRRDGRPAPDTPFFLVASPVPEKAHGRLEALFRPYRPLRVGPATDFDAVVSFPTYDLAVQAQFALQCTPFEGTDLCLYYGVEGLDQKEKYNAACTTCVITPAVGSVSCQEIYDLFKPYSGGFHMQVVKMNGCALVSFQERPLAVVAQSVFSGYSLGGKAIAITLLDYFDPSALGPYHDSAFIFPISDVVNKSDLLDVFDPFLSLDVDLKTCVAINRETSIATVTGFASRLHSRLAEKAVNGLHLGGTELMLRHRLCDLSLPKENRVFISNVTDDITCPDLYAIFQEFKGGEPMQVVIKRSKRYALIGYRTPNAAATAVSTLGNVQVRGSLLYLYLSD